MVLTDSANLRSPRGSRGHSARQPSTWTFISLSEPALPFRCHATTAKPARIRFRTPRHALLRSRHSPALEDQVEANIRASVRKFLETYKTINWHDLHGRLQHFRNHGLAHLLPQRIKKRVSYAEIASLVRSVTVLGECLVSFDPGGVPLRVDEIKDWSDRAKSVWEAAFRELRT